MNKKFTDTEKDQIVFKIVYGELFLEEASEKYKVSTVSLIKWLKERKSKIETYFAERKAQ